MGERSLNKDQPQAIRMVFQRLIEDESVVQLLFGAFRSDVRVLAEAPDRVILGITALERGQWKLKSGSRLTLNLVDRGLPYEAVVDYQGHGQVHGVEAAHVTMPRQLRALDTHRLADFVPDRPIPCTFADQQNNVKDGHATAFGEDCLELAPPEGTRILGDMLRLNATSTAELRIAAGDSLILPVRVAYFAERVWGLRITEGADKLQLGRYRQWLMEQRHHMSRKDLERFSPAGLQSPRLASRSVAAPRASLRILVDRDPMLLLLAEGETFATRLAEAVGRKFGVAFLDVGPGPLRPLLGDLGVDEQDWGRLRLVLIHYRLRAGSPLERCKRLTQEEACPLPVLLIGTEEEAVLKRNRAVAAGAVDFLVVEPFRVLSVLRTLDDTLKLFT
jgi:CheY-like chemotaxis protein